MRAWPLMLLLAGSCAKSSAPPPAPQADVPADAPPPSLFVHMQEHAAVTLQVRDALLTGRVAQARTALEDLAAHDIHPAIPPELEPYARGLKMEAAEAGPTTTTAGLAGILGRSAGWCGQCHQAAGVVLSSAHDPVPSGDVLTRHMARWRWATDRLWEGVVLPSDEAWALGADVLDQDALSVADVPHDGERAAIIESLATFVSRLGRAAGTATTPEDRTEILGLTVGMCASCHAETGGPQPDPGVR